MYWKTCTISVLKKFNFINRIASLHILKNVYYSIKMTHAIKTTRKLLVKWLCFLLPSLTINNLIYTIIINCLGKDCTLKKAASLHLITALRQIIDCSIQLCVPSAAWALQHSLSTTFTKIKWWWNDASCIYY